MATLPRRKLNLGMIIDRVVDVVSRNAMPCLVFIVVFAGLNVLTDWLTQGAILRQLLFSLIVALATVVGAFPLTQIMLRSMGLLSYKGAPRILPFLGLALIALIADQLALLCFIIPGLILMARWAIAAPLLIGEGRGVFDSLGESWEKTRGSEMPIILTFLILVISFTVVGVVAGLYVPRAGIAATIVSKLAGSVGSTLSIANGVAIYGLLTGGQNAAETFK